LICQTRSNRQPPLQQQIGFHASSLVASQEVSTTGKLSAAALQ